MATIGFLPTIVDEATVLEFLAMAGERVGVGDWRPRFGRCLVAAT